MLTATQIEKAEFVGRAMAHDVVREGYDRSWTGLEVEDGDQLMTVGLDGTMPEWSEAEEIARQSYESELAK